MSDSADPSSSSEPIERAEQFFGLLRNAFTTNASPDVRSAAAVACRTLLRALEPSSAIGDAASPPASPMAGMVGAVKAMPREQLLEIATGVLRSFFVSRTPAYRTAPTRGEARDPTEVKP